MPPWIGPGPHDRDLDHQVVELLAASAAAASTSARAIRSGTRRPCRRAGSSRRRPDPRPGCRCMRSVVPRMRDTRSSARRIADQHAEREHVDLEQAQRIEVVLVPLDDGAVGHRRVLDRHQLARAARARSRSRRRAATGGAESRAARRRARPRAGSRGLSGSKPASRRRSRCDGAAVPPRERAGQPVELREVEAERAGRRRAPRSAAGSVITRRGERGAIAAVLAVDVLDHLLAPLVLEVDVDVRRLVALLADEALEQHVACAPGRPR